MGWDLIGLGVRLDMGLDLEWDGMRWDGMEFDRNTGTSQLHIRVIHTKTITSLSSV